MHPKKTQNNPWTQYKQLMCTYPRQGEFLHDLAVIYESIIGIDHWWIGLSDVGKQIKSNQIKIFIFLQLQDMYIG